MKAADEQTEEFKPKFQTQGLDVCVLMFLVEQPRETEIHACVVYVNNIGEN